MSTIPKLLDTLHQQLAISDNRIKNLEKILDEYTEKEKSIGEKMDKILKDFNEKYQEFCRILEETK